MRTLSFILAFGFVLASAGLTSPTGDSMPGAGTFSYSDTSATDTAATFAYLTLTKRTRA
ncbi:hypothetical protein [Tardiphaga alba]|uniref:hypothetical protein n=1 Tax=Tardiphaga alba TaxID=340268 RepID=UPI001BA52CB2|nr:hypothetical protein [Tardiphaga alba]